MFVSASSIFGAPDPVAAYRELAGLAVGVSVAGRAGRPALERAALSRAPAGSPCNGRGRVSPNPLVGAVILRDGEIVAEGWHEGPGLPHAEAMALAAAGDAARGSTVVCTLEPCSHTGRTPPCADALVAAGRRAGS